MDDCRRISRRVVLASAAFSFGAAAAATVVSRTAAQQKLSQGDAKYQTAPKGDQRCEGCANFQAPNGDGLTLAPVLIIDFDAVLRFDKAHVTRPRL